MKLESSAKLVLALFLVLTLASPILEVFPSTAVKAQPAPLYGPYVDEIQIYSTPDLVSPLINNQVALALSSLPPGNATSVLQTGHFSYLLDPFLSFELTFNPVGPVFGNGTLNPFSVPRIREAVIYLINRTYIVQNFFVGFAYPKFLPLIRYWPEYYRYQYTISSIERDYSYNFSKAESIITSEMLKLNATYQDGKWYYKGSPVNIIFLIRVEDQRKQIGNYVADQLEKLGFTVTRKYGTSRDLSPIWKSGNPADGKWHIYTGAWISTADEERDSASYFGFFYTPLANYMGPLWQAYKPDPTFYEVAARLWNGDFRSWGERGQLMRRAMVLAMKDSARVWLVDTINLYLYRKELEVSSFSQSWWCRTLKWSNGTGGTVKAGIRELFLDPWNPVAGSNWVYDFVVQSCTTTSATFPHYSSGLPVPENIQSAEVIVLKGTPITSQWVNLSYADSITVPPDAWYAYNVSLGRVVTAGEAGVRSAQAKVVVNYGDVIGKVRYHDNTTMSLADWVLWWPLYFARADNSSTLYDESWLPYFDVWRQQFRGWKIVSTSPLVIEYYVNYTALDAEEIVASFAYWPTNPWHMLAIGIRAEEKGLLAFSADKATKLNVEWMSYIGGQSLDVLSRMLNESTVEGYIPFGTFMSQYIKASEAQARYQALKGWYQAHAHFWVADGPYYLSKADINAHSGILKANRQFRYTEDYYAKMQVAPDLNRYPYVLAVQGGSNSIYYTVCNASTCKGWSRLPGSTPDSPSLAPSTLYSNRVYIVVRGGDNGIYFGYLDSASGSFSGWQKLPGSTPSKPVLVGASRFLVLVVRGGDNKIYYNVYNETTATWSGWKRLPTGSTIDAPGATVTGFMLHVVVRGNDGRSLWYGALNLLSGSFSGWSVLPGSTPSFPFLGSDGNYVWLAVRGGDNSIYIKTWSPVTGWQNWERVPTGTTVKTPLAYISGGAYT